MTIPINAADVESTPPKVTARGTRAIMRNTALNLGGVAAPVAVAIIALPLLNRHLGTERVGFLTLVWALIGYVSLFDLGIGRALTKLVAERLSSGDTVGLHRVVRTSLALMLVLGVLGGLALAVVAGWLVGSILRIPAALQEEASRAMRLLAFAVPIVVITAGLRGILEAQGRFLIANVIRAPLGVWIFVAPLMIIPFGSRSLVWVVGLLVVGRLLAAIAYFVACFRGGAFLGDGIGLAWDEIARLLRFGGWMTISNVLSPTMAYLDRFFVGSQVSLQHVAWYAAPFEVVTKILLVSTATAAVLFPTFSSLTRDHGKDAERLHRLSARYLGLLLFIPAFGASLFAEDVLEVWLGHDFAVHGRIVAQLIAFGTLVNGIAHVPFALLQGAGRPDLTAKVHLFELPFYIALVVWLTSNLGIAGTALAWSLRTTLDLVILEGLARLHSGGPALPRLRSSVLPVAAVMLFATSLVSMPLPAKFLLIAFVVTADALLIWNVLLEKDGLSHLKGSLLTTLSSLTRRKAKAAR